MTTVIVTLCNDDFVGAAVGLVGLVRGVGAYNGPIVVLYSGTRALEATEFKGPNVTLKAVETLFDADVRRAPTPPCSDGSAFREKRARRAGAYYTKTAVFSSYFKRWDRVLWMDARLGVYRPLAPFFDAIDSAGALLANPDAWPAFADQWPLSLQFYPECDAELFARLSARFDMRREYFQSGLMLFDTALLDANTLGDIARLYAEFSSISSGDQPIFSIYWGQVRGVYKQLPYRLPQSLEVPYDFEARVAGARYITLANRDGA